jgi:hypothetical protein
MDHSKIIIQAIKQIRMGWVGYGARMGQRGGSFRVLEGNPAQTTPLGGLRRRSDDNTKLDFK